MMQNEKKQIGSLRFNEWIRSCIGVGYAETKKNGWFLYDCPVADPTKLLNARLLGAWTRIFVSELSAANCAILRAIQEVKFSRYKYEHAKSKV